MTTQLEYYKYFGMEEKILCFRNITQDQEIDESEVIKFINWSKGDIQQALNYYYKNLEKGKIKKTSKLKLSKSPQKIQIKEDESKKIEKQKVIFVNRHSQSSISGNEKNLHSNSVNAFSVLKQGSLQHKKTHDFIKKVRQIYKLPIKGKPQKQLLKNSQSCLAQNEGKISEEFIMVDSLSQGLNPQYIQQLLDKKSAQTEPVKIFVPQQEKQQVRSSYKNQFVDVDVSISESIKGQKKLNPISSQEQPQFQDLQNYEYKHIYTNSSLIKKQETKLRKDNTSRQIQQSKQIKQSNKQDKGLKSAKQNIKQPIANNGKVKQKSKPKLQMKQTKITNQILLNKNVNKHEEQQGKIGALQEEELYIGQYFARGVCTDKRKFDLSWNGAEVETQTYIEEEKAKKKNFGKRAERAMNIRIIWEGRSIGRIADEQVRIIMPLIENNLIRVAFYFHDLPPFADVLKSLTFRANVFVKRRLITQPILQTFQPQQSDKQRVDQLSALFTKLSLPILTEPLIKAKSKYLKETKKKKQIKKSSMDIFQFENGQEQQKAKQQQQKTKNEYYRVRNDPNYKQKQQSLKDMISKNEQSIKKAIKEKQQDQAQQGQIQKKVIQIDNQQQKDKLSQLIQLHDENCEPYYPKVNFTSHLYQYQALALAWMLKREGYLTNQEEKEQLHPLWTQYAVPTTQKYHLYFNELNGQVCVRRPTAVLKCKGGILADEMGLGKTVMMTALIVSNPQQLTQKNQAGTLVIVPLTLLSQWQSQICKHTENQKVIAYYSADRKKIANFLSNYDVVISTYGTVSHQFAQGCHSNKSGIYKYKWHRVILDEAHYIKGRIIQTSKAVYQLNSTNKWCLTGTPIQNTITDIFSLLHFIKYTPWSEFSCWNRFIVKPLEEGDERIYQILRTILKQVFLRRTKNSQGPEGKPIIELPPRVSKIELLTMSEKERQFYNSIYTSSRSSFDELIDKGILQAKYMQVLEMLMRLRQICCHPILFKSVTKFTKNNQQFQIQINKLIKRSQQRKKNSQSQSQDEYYEPIINIENEQIRVKANNTVVSQQYLKEVLEKVANQNLDNCIICLNQPEDPIITCCLHIFCKSCNIRQIQQKGTCSFCRRQLTKEDYIHLPRQDRLNLKKDNSKDVIFPSTKMIALNQHLANLAINDKAVIFSQFLGMLDLLQAELKKNAIKFVRMQGSNTHKERTKIVQSFQEDPSIQVFLVSLKTAGVGLNLVAANKVFLMDPWWNPAVEEQAIERVHRIGQKRSVQIYRFIMDRTIQTRMLQLNTQKKILSQSVLNQYQDKANSVNHKVEKLKYLMENY